MTYKYGEWILHEIEVNFKHIGIRKMYFFSKGTPKRGTPCDLPEGYKVEVNKRTGLPYLKYKNKISLHQRNKQLKK
jgi:hypothetical protein